MFMQQRLSGLPHIWREPHTMTTTPHVSVLDAAQQRLDALGATIEASRRDPESVGGPEAPAGADVVGVWDGADRYVAWPQTTTARQIRIGAYGLQRLDGGLHELSVGIDNLATDQPAVELPAADARAVATAICAAADQLEAAAAVVRKPCVRGCPRRRPTPDRWPSATSASTNQRTSHPTEPPCSGTGHSSAMARSATGTSPSTPPNREPASRSTSTT